MTIILLVTPKLLKSNETINLHEFVSGKLDSEQSSNDKGLFARPIMWTGLRDGY